MRLAAPLACLVLFPGCLLPNEGVPVDRANDPTRRLPLRLAGEICERIDERLLVPIVIDDEGKNAMAFKTAGMAFSSGSWSGFGSGYGSDRRRVNLEIVELSSGEHHRVFDRPVALGDWDLSFKFRPGEEARGAHPGTLELRWPGLLVLRARTTDTDKDGQYTDRDSVEVFIYDLDKHHLAPISPPGHGVVQWLFKGDALLMVTRPDSLADGISVHRFDPATRQTLCIVHELTP